MNMIADELDRIIRNKVAKSLKEQGALVGPHQFEGFVELESENVAKFIMRLYEIEEFEASG